MHVCLACGNIYPLLASRAVDIPAVLPLLEEIRRRANGLDCLSQRQYLNGCTYLPEDMWVKVDQTSMLNSLETRCPSLDHRFLELAARVPPSLRVTSGEGKYILKQALRGRGREADGAECVVAAPTGGSVGPGGLYGGIIGVKVGRGTDDMEYGDRLVRINTFESSDRCREKVRSGEIAVWSCARSGYAVDN